MKRFRAQVQPHMDAHLARAPVERPTVPRADKNLEKQRQTLPTGESKKKISRDLTLDCHWLGSEDKASNQREQSRATSNTDEIEEAGISSDLEESQAEVEDLAVIRQADGEDRSNVAFSLEVALSAGEPFVVIQDRSLASETRISISIGNFLHKGAVLSGLLCLCTGLLGTPRLAVQAGLMSGLCAIVYDTSWAYDSCCQYQVARLDRWYEELPMTNQLDLDDLASATVLVKKDDRVRRKLHNFLAGCSLGVCAVKICWPGPS